MDSVWVVPAGQVMCFALRTDPNGVSTLGELDDIGADCLEAGSNLEVRLVRTMPVEPSKVVEAACEATGAHAPCS